MSSALLDPTAPVSTATAGRSGPAGRRHVLWLLGGLTGSFLVPFVFADLLGMQRDVYLLVYVGFVGLLVTGWLRDTGESAVGLVRRRWRLALGLSALFAIVSVLLVVKAADSSSHPGGLTFAGAVVWRGLVYGAADGVLLTAFPIVAVFAAFGLLHGQHARKTMVRAGAVALLASVAFTAIYHLGYPDFRSKKVVKPIAGDIVAWAPPTLLTLNPIGAPIVHATMHVAAVTRSYDTDIFLPPH